MKRRRNETKAQDESEADTLANAPICWSTLNGWTISGGNQVASPYVHRKARGNYQPPKPLDICTSHRTVVQNAYKNFVEKVESPKRRAYNQGWITLDSPLELSGEPRGTLGNSNFIQENIHFRCGTTGTHVGVHIDEVSDNAWSLVHQVHGHKVYLLFAPPENNACVETYLQHLNTVLDFPAIEGFLLQKDFYVFPPEQLITKVYSKISNLLHRTNFPKNKNTLVVLNPGDTLWFLASYPHAAINIGLWTMCLLHNFYTKRYFEAHLDDVIRVGMGGDTESELAVQTWADAIMVRQVREELPTAPKIEDKIRIISTFSSMEKAKKKNQGEGQTARAKHRPSSIIYDSLLSFSMRKIALLHDRSRSRSRS